MQKVFLITVIAITLIACNSNISYDKLQKNGEYYTYNGEQFTGTTTDKWENDTIKSYIEWKDGEINGICKHYNKSGKIIDSANYINNKIHGNYIKYYDNGKTQLICTYLNGIQDGECLAFNDKGQLISKCIYSSGSIVGSLTTYTIKEYQIPETITKKFNDIIFKFFPSLSYDWDNDYKCNFWCTGSNDKIRIWFNAKNTDCNKIYSYTYRIDIYLDLINEKIPNEIILENVFQKIISDFKGRCSEEQINFIKDIGNFSTNDSYTHIVNTNDDVYYHYEIRNKNDDTFYYDSEGNFVAFEEIAY